MQNLKELIETYSQPGRLNWIGVRPARRAAVVPVDAVEVLPDGLVGDHGASAKRAVTLIQAEHLPVIGAMLGVGPVPAEALRRNLVISGINLGALKGRRISVGSAVLEVTGICAPCSRMEEAFGKGGYSAVRGHGGICARVIRPGRLSLGDRVIPLTTAAQELSNEPIGRNED